MLFSKPNLHDWQLNLFKSFFIHFTTQVDSPGTEPIQLSTGIGSIQLTTQAASENIDSNQFTAEA